MGTCYASVVGGCAGGFSKEHPVSRAVLNEIGEEGRPLRHRGAARFGGGEGLVAVDDNQAKILCRKHNSALSPLDATGLQFFRALKAASNPSARIAITAKFGGAAVERWLLKCACGILTARMAASEKGDPYDVHVPARWVEILFAKERWPRGWGIYIDPLWADPKPREHESFGFAPILGRGRITHGAVFFVCGLGLGLCLNRPFEDDENFRRSMYRPRLLKIRNGIVEHRLRFAWLDGATNNDVTLNVVTAPSPD